MRNIRKKFKRPRMLWNAAVIEKDKAVLKDFGLRRKKELWRSAAILRDFRQRARELNAEKDEKKEKELITKLVRLGMLKESSTLDDVLGLQLEDLLNRRLQTIVHKRGLAPTLKQSRQMITHGHIEVGGVRTSFPSFLIPVDKEASIKMTTSSAGKFEPKEKPEPKEAPKAEAAA